MTHATRLGHSATSGPDLAAGGDRMSLATVRRSWLERVLGVVRELGATPDLTDTLELIAAAVVDELHFGAAAINIVRPDGLVWVAAVAGPPDVHQLLGRSTPVARWEEVLAASEAWGELRFFGRGHDQQLLEGLAKWTPEAPPTPVNDAWYPEDSLFAPLRDEDGTLLGVISVDQPRSGRRPDLEQRTVLELFASQAAIAVREAHRRADLRDREMIYRTVFTSTPSPTLILSADGVVLAANPAFCTLVGRSRHEVVGVSIDTFVHPDDVEDAREIFADVAARPGGEDSLEHRVPSHDGVERWVRTTLRQIDGSVADPRVVLTVEDVTDGRRVLEELRYLADHDHLTGLPNRRKGLRHLQRSLTGSRSSRIALLSCDIDGFKDINDEFGHHVGDLLLVAVANRLAGAVRPQDLLCRHGGDEFVIIASVTEESDAVTIAQRCVEAVGRRFVLDSVTCEVSISVGVAMAVAAGRTTQDLLDAADQALYGAKDAGKARWQVWSRTG